MSRVGLTIIVFLSVLLLISVGMNLYQIATQTENKLPPKTLTTVTTTSTETSTVNELHTTTVLNANDSLSNIIVSNVSLGCYPLYTTLDPLTNVFYAYCTNSLAPGNRTNYLVSMDANTNTVIARTGNISEGHLVMNPVTNMLYISNEEINGTTNRVVGEIGPNMTFVTVDVKNNILYAVDDSSNPQGTTLYEINGTNYVTMRSQFFKGIDLFGGFAFDNESSLLFALDSEGVTSIDAGNLMMQSNLPLNSASLNTVSIAFNPATNAIYVSGLPNLLFVINGTNDALLAEIPITAYQNNIFDIAVNPSANQIMLIGMPTCTGLSECDLTDLFVLSADNYGELATFIDYGANQTPPWLLQFDPANGETYMFLVGTYVLVLEVPTYQSSPPLP